mmetsp:Transcript_40059/g.127491  ORF Transcript_40059/g.127491 Transcript_40059/m.127491 type:complete len:236 (+) Transcript_40059:242-949(+)
MRAAVQVLAVIVIALLDLGLSITATACTRHCSTVLNECHGAGRAIGEMPRISVTNLVTDLLALLALLALIALIALLALLFVVVLLILLLVLLVLLVLLTFVNLAMVTSAVLSIIHFVLAILKCALAVLLRKLHETLELGGESVGHPPSPHPRLPCNVRTTKAGMPLCCDWARCSSQVISSIPLRRPQVFAQGPRPGTPECAPQAQRLCKVMDEQTTAEDVRPLLEYRCQLALFCR